MTSQEEIDRIHNIFLKYEIDGIFGYQKRNCEDKVFYSELPNSVVLYGGISPEWLSQFSGESSRYGDLVGIIPNAYAMRDYNAAQKNLSTIMENYNFGQDDQKEVMSFFDKEWKKYADSYPMAVIVKKEKKLKDGYSEDNYLDLLYNRISTDHDYTNFEDFINYIIYYGKIDESTDKCIDTSNATFIKLPSYRQFMIDGFEIEPNEEYYSKEEFIKIFRNIVLSSGYKQVHFDEKKFANSAYEYLDSESIISVINGLKEKDYSSFFLVKKLAIINPEKFKDAIAFWSNIPFYMRDVACQKGIKPSLINYIGEDVLNDMQFFVNMINHTTPETFDFYTDENERESDSHMKYSKLIGPKVQTNPLFWDLLNLKIKSINETTGENRPYFDKEVELAIAEKRFNPNKKETLLK